MATGLLRSCHDVDRIMERMMVAGKIYMMLNPLKPHWKILLYIL